MLRDSLKTLYVWSDSAVSVQGHEASEEDSSQSAQEGVEPEQHSDTDAGASSHTSGDLGDSIGVQPSTKK